MIPFVAILSNRWSDPRGGTSVAALALRSGAGAPVPRTAHEEVCRNHLRCRHRPCRVRRLPARPAIRAGPLGHSRRQCDDRPRRLGHRDLRMKLFIDPENLKAQYAASPDYEVDGRTSPPRQDHRRTSGLIRIQARPRFSSSPCHDPDAPPPCLRCASRHWREVHKRVYVLVNHKAEGSSPLTVAALPRQLAGGGAR